MTNDELKTVIRQAGGIVHSDGNIFFTNSEQFLAAAAEAREIAWCVECSDGITAHDPGICGTCYATKYERPTPSPL